MQAPQRTAARTKLESLFASQRHPFHILRPSAYPVAVSFFLFLWLVPQTFYMHGVQFAGAAQTYIITGSLTMVFVLVMSWFSDILFESSKGFHTKRVQKGLRLGMMLFIVSEVMFFFAFFWAFFHYSLVPSAAIGATWPPTGTQQINAWGLPLVNTLLLLASGVTITIAHAKILNNQKKAFFWYLTLTIVLGVFFLFCQGYEYKYGIKFSWRDNVYGSIFFITTGFHGFHVTVGTMFLLFCLGRQFLTEYNYDQENTETLVLKTFKMTPSHHFGFEAAAWYWHFVDVVWLFLFITIYWWSGL